MSRHPRAVRELMEGEVMVLITGTDALRRLTDDCRFPEARARRLLNIAWEFGQKAEPCPGGYVHIWYHGKDDSQNHIYSVVEHIGGKQPGKVAPGKSSRYTQSKTANPETGTAKPTRRKVGTEMPPRKNTRKQAAPEPETPANGEVDYQKFIGSKLSPTMEDYVTWFETNVSPLDNDELPLEKILTLGVSLYGHFQKSDFNISRREERQAAREEARAASSEPEDEPEPETRTRTRKGPAKAATGRTARSTAAPRRARAKAGAAAGGDAPF